MFLFFIFSVHSNELKESQVSFLFEAVVSGLFEVSYCGSEYSSLKSDSEKARGYLNSIRGKINNYYTSHYSESKFESIEMSSLFSISGKVTKRRSSDYYSKEKCSSIIASSSQEGFSPELLGILERIGS